MEKKLMILLLFTIFISSLVFAQQDSVDATKNKAFGVQYNLVVGYGLTYRAPIVNEKSSVQAVAGFYSIGSDSKYSIGAEYLYRLARLESIDVTIGPGVGLFKSNSTKSTVHAGFGLGLEYRLPSNVTENYFIFFGRLYYPTYYTSSGNLSIGGALGFMVAL